MGAGLVYRQLSRTREDNKASTVSQYGGNSTDDAEVSSSSVIPPSSDGLPSRSDRVRYKVDAPSLYAVTGTTSSDFLSNVPCVPDSRGMEAVDASLQPREPRHRQVGETEREANYQGHRSSVAVSAMEGAERSPNEEDKVSNAIEESGTSGTVAFDGSRTAARGIGVGHAVMAAAQELAQMSQIPGIPEAARLVIILMNLLTDSSNIMGTADHMVKRCRSLMVLLRRAASLLEEVRVGVAGDACCLSQQLAIN